MKQWRLVGLGLAFALSLAGVSLLAIGQQPSPPAAAPAAGLFDSLHFRQIGPASMSGRISDLAVYEADPNIFYVGTAHGGVWKTTNNGTTFEAQFQAQGLMSIGDVTVSQSNPDLVWVGTGEANNRQSTSWGDGVYKSTDGGKTYTNVGLRSSRHINRILIDPRDNNVVFVAAVGSLWGPGGERGVYKTVDGGRTWKQVLKVDDDTGANDLVMDPSNDRILYASTYQRRRTACCMNGGGPGSGFWKSIDGGETWTRLKGNGLPDGPLGRIAIDVYRRRPNILYAEIEGPVVAAGRGAGGGAAAPAGGAAASAEQGPGQAAPAGGGRGGPATGVNPAPTGVYRSDDGGATWRKVNNVNPRPMYFSQVRVDPNDADTVYLGGVKMHQSQDAGKSFLTDVSTTAHDDVHAIWIDPSNSKHILIGEDGGLSVSYDMARTWVFYPNLPVGTFYHVSYDMAIPYNVCGGLQDNYDWCGPSAVRGAVGIANYHWATVQGGDGFVVLQDPVDARVAYSESQDGNMVRVDRKTFETMSIRPQPNPGEPTLRWHWDTPLVMSPHDPKVVYAAANKVFRSADKGLSWTAISPDLTSGASRDEIVTMGLKNTDIQISRNDGISAWPTIVAFAESPRRAGILWAGTDDGHLAVSRDAGKTWTQMVEKIGGLPKDIFVSEVVPSRFDDGTVYATFDGHRQNDFGTYVYASTDFGQSWKPIVNNLDGEVVKTLTEDLKNRDVLYVGTETGLFVSLNRGQSWTRIKANLPTVRIDEITLHPRDNAMILATHGRSIWILDHLEPIQEYAAAQAATDARLFAPPTYAMYRRPARDRNYEFWGDQTFYGENPPQSAVITWFLKRQVGDVKLKIADGAGHEVREISGTVLANSNKAGLQSACWDLRVQPIPAAAPAGRGGRGGAPEGQPQPLPTLPPTSPFGAGCGTAGGMGGGGGFGAMGGGNAGPYVLPGTYQVSLIVDGKTVETRPLKVMADPEVVLTEVQRKQLFDMAMELHDLQKVASNVAATLAPFNTRMGEIGKEIAGRNEVPADVKASFEAVNKDLGTLVPKFAAGGGRGGAGGAGGAGGGRGVTPEPTPMARLTQAKNGLMGGMWPTDQTMKAYAEAKAKVPAAIADVNGMLAKATTLATTLEKYNVKLTVPAAIKAPPVKKSTS